MRGGVGLLHQHRHTMQGFRAFLECSSFLVLVEDMPKGHSWECQAPTAETSVQSISDAQSSWKGQALASLVQVLSGALQVGHSSCQA